MAQNKKANSVGCLIYLLLVVPPYFYYPLKPAIGFTIVCSLMGFILPEIDRIIGNIKKRTETNKSTIAATREGFHEVIAKIQNEELLFTFMDHRAVDYHQVSCLKKFRNYEHKSKFAQMYEHASHLSKLLLSDGSAKLWVSLHETEMHILQRKKKLKKAEFLQLLQASPLPNFPIDELSDTEYVWVLEKYIPAGQEVYCYGIVHKLKTHSLPTALLEAQESKKAKSAAHTKLSEADWQEMTADTFGELKLMTADYSPSTYIEKLIISLKGDYRLKWKAYFQIFFMVLMILVILAFYGLYLWKAYPEILPF